MDYGYLASIGGKMIDEQAEFEVRPASDVLKEEPGFFDAPREEDIPGWEEQASAGAMLRNSGRLMRYGLGTAGRAGMSGAMEALKNVNRNHFGRIAVNREIMPAWERTDEIMKGLGIEGWGGKIDPLFGGAGAMGRGGGPLVYGGALGLSIVQQKMAESAATGKPLEPFKDLGRAYMRGAKLEELGGQSELWEQKHGRPKPLSQETVDKLPGFLKWFPSGEEIARGAGGLAVECVLDFVSYLDFFQLTDAGRVARAQGELGATLAEQAGRGQWTPMKFARAPVGKGQKLAEALSFANAKYMDTGFGKFMQQTFGHGSRVPAIDRPLRGAYGKLSGKTPEASQIASRQARALMDIESDWIRLESNLPTPLKPLADWKPKAGYRMDDVIDSALNEAGLASGRVGAREGLLQPFDLTRDLRKGEGVAWLHPKRMLDELQGSPNMPTGALRPGSEMADERVWELFGRGQRWSPARVSAGGVDPVLDAMIEMTPTGGARLTAEGTLQPYGAMVKAGAPAVPVAAAADEIDMLERWLGPTRRELDEFAWATGRTPDAEYVERLRRGLEKRMPAELVDETLDVALESRRIYDSEFLEQIQGGVRIAERAGYGPVIFTREGKGYLQQMERGMPATMWTRTMDHAHEWWFTKGHGDHAAINALAAKDGLAPFLEKAPGFEAALKAYGVDIHKPIKQLIETEHGWLMEQYLMESARTRITRQMADDFAALPGAVRVDAAPVEEVRWLLDHGWRQPRQLGLQGVLFPRDMADEIDRVLGMVYEPLDLTKWLASRDETKLGKVLKGHVDAGNAIDVRHLTSPELEELTELGFVPAGGAVGDQVWVKPVAARELAQTAAGLDDPGLAQMAARVSTKSLKEITQYFDISHSWVKANQLAPRAAWHTRNCGGNAWGAYLAGVKNPWVFHDSARIVNEMWEPTTRVGKEYKRFAAKVLDVTAPGTMDDAARRWGFVDAQDLMNRAREGVADIGLMATEARGLGGKRLAPWAARLNKVVGTDSEIVKMGRTVASMLENNARLATFMSQVKWLTDHGVSVDDAALDAVRTVNKVLYNYTDFGLSGREREWAKRMFSFYTWARNNIPLQLEMYVKHPGTFSKMGKGFHAWDVMQGEPSWSGVQELDEYGEWQPTTPVDTEPAGGEPSMMDPKLLSQMPVRTGETYQAMDNWWSGGDIAVPWDLVTEPERALMTLYDLGFEELNMMLKVGPEYLSRWSTYWKGPVEGKREWGPFVMDRRDIQLMRQIPHVGLVEQPWKLARAGEPGKALSRVLVGKRYDYLPAEEWRWRVYEYSRLAMRYQEAKNKGNWHGTWVYKDQLNELAKAMGPEWEVDWDAE